MRVAEDSARGLVHRYMVMVQQNARRVSPVTSPWLDATPGPLIGGRNIAALANNDATPSHRIALSNRDCIASHIISLQGTASCLTRSEVRGGGKKPYAQKGTGNARRGSSTSPLFAGGGVSFGPKVRWAVEVSPSCSARGRHEQLGLTPVLADQLSVSYQLPYIDVAQKLYICSQSQPHVLTMHPSLESLHATWVAHSRMTHASACPRISLPISRFLPTRFPPSSPTHASIIPRPPRRAAQGHACLTRPPPPPSPPARPS